MGTTPICAYCGRPISDEPKWMLDENWNEEDVTCHEQVHLITEDRVREIGAGRIEQNIQTYARKCGFVL